LTVCDKKLWVCRMRRSSGVLVCCVPCVDTLRFLYRLLPDRLVQSGRPHAPLRLEVATRRPPRYRMPAFVPCPRGANVSLERTVDGHLRRRTGRRRHDRVDVGRRAHAEGGFGGSGKRQLRHRRRKTPDGRGGRPSTWPWQQPPHAAPAAATATPAAVVAGRGWWRVAEGARGGSAAGREERSRVTRQGNCTSRSRGRRDCGGGRNKQGAYRLCGSTHRSKRSAGKGSPVQQRSGRCRQLAAEAALAGKKKHPRLRHTGCPATARRLSRPPTNPMLDPLTVTRWTVAATHAPPLLHGTLPSCQWRAHQRASGLPIRDISNKFFRGTFYLFLGWGFTL